ncbi:MAG: beta-lactamase family protein [Leptospirales bacterium]|nr:beta-lactamase family protein [Leptospirales bacterium]
MKMLSFKRGKLGMAPCFVVLVSAAFACREHRARDELRTKFQAEVKVLVSEFNLPGMTAAYTLSDGTTEGFAAGFSDLELRAPMEKNSRMLAASIGKTFVGALVMDLVSEQKLRLDAPVKEYLSEEPWFARLPNHDTMTVRQLLTHSSGIDDHVESPKFRDDFRKLLRQRGIIAPPELVSYVLDTPPRFKAGTAFHYSDTGYILAGLIVEKVTGEKLFGLIQKRFIEPQALTLTSASDTTELPGLASGYLAKNNPLALPTKTTIRPGSMVWNPAIEWAGGGLISNSADLAKWSWSLYSGAVLKGNYLDDLLQSIEVTPSLRYGIATVIRGSPQHQPSYGHSGWIPGYCSNMQYYPEMQAAIAFQINTDIGMKGNRENPLDMIETRLARLVSEFMHQGKAP